VGRSALDDLQGATASVLYISRTDDNVARSSRGALFLLTLALVMIRPRGLSEAVVAGAGGALVILWAL
jgi:hypothetical protein